MLASSSGLTRLKDPTALFEFTLNPDTSSQQGQRGQEENEEESERDEQQQQQRDGDNKLLVEFSHQELYQFFLDLEKMQQQLDSMT